MVAIDPRRHDFFRHAVEQRQHHKSSNEPLSACLKTLANSGSYGLFVEVTPEVLRTPIMLGVFSGERKFDAQSSVLERQGRWYFPLLAALITAGGRLLLGMLERCVTDAGGTYLFCDTDSLCIVASERGGLVPCEGGPHRKEDQPAIQALSRAQVVAIAKRFASLNPYDPTHVPGSILKIEKVNSDNTGRRRALYGFAISAKRYVLYERTGTGVDVVDPPKHRISLLPLFEEQR